MVNLIHYNNTGNSVQYRNSPTYIPSQLMPLKLLFRQKLNHDDFFFNLLSV